MSYTFEAGKYVLRVGACRIFEDEEVSLLVDPNGCVLKHGSKAYILATREAIQRDAKRHLVCLTGRFLVDELNRVVDSRDASALLAHIPADVTVR